MSEPLRCPDCGHQNPAGAIQCERCNFPLVETPLAGDPARPSESLATSPPEHADPASTADVAAAPEYPIFLRRPRRRARAAPMLSLWLTFGLFAAAAMIWVAVQVQLDRRRQPAVEGAGPKQQERIDALRAALERDSTNVQAQVGLADVLYDTGNWPEAIVHYRAALRRDSTLVTALVDLGVCYYNLSQPEDAERLFHLAIARDPHQPVALFNLGIVHERRGESEAALQYFHRALESSPPADMQQPLVEAIRRIQEKTGRTAPPLDQGR